MDQIGPTIHQKKDEIVFLYQKYLLLRIFFAEHTLSEEIILNEVSLGKSPTINFTLMRSHFLFSNCQ